MSVLSTMGWGERLPYGQIPDFQWVVECSSRQKPRACKREGESRRNKELGRGYEPASGCDKAADFVRCHRRPSPSSCPCLASARSASQPRRQSRSESTGSCNQNIDADDADWGILNLMMLIEGILILMMLIGGILMLLMLIGGILNLMMLIGGILMLMMVIGGILKTKRTHVANCDAGSCKKSHRCRDRFTRVR